MCPFVSCNSGILRFIQLFLSIEKETIKNKTLIKNIMAKKILIGLALIFAFSCNIDKDDSINKDEDDSIKQGNGKVWVSGGLLHCATQIHLDNGDTLIVKSKDIISVMSEERVSVRYKETGINKLCSPYIDCEIIEIKKVK